MSYTASLKLTGGKKDQVDDGTLPAARTTPALGESKRTGLRVPRPQRRRFCGLGCYTTTPPAVDLPQDSNHPDMPGEDRTTRSTARHQGKPPLITPPTADHRQCSQEAHRPARPVEPASALFAADVYFFRCAIKEPQLKGEVGWLVILTNQLIVCP